MIVVLPEPIQELKDLDDQAVVPEAVQYGYKVLSTTLVEPKVKKPVVVKEKKEK